MNKNIRWFSQLGMNDVGLVGGKNASLGEMIANLSSAGIDVPNGFATTADAYRGFLRQDDLDRRIHDRLANLDVEDVDALSAAGQEIRDLVLHNPLPKDLETAIRTAYAELCPNDEAVAVRSSATAEDLPEASFAGQQETFLNISGVTHALAAVKDVFASLFNNRAIAYRVHQGFDHAEVALSAGIQRMVRSDRGASGVLFTIDTESGFRDAVFITASWGLGESVVQGSVNPDEFYVYKPALARGDAAILRRGLGSKATKMVYSGKTGIGHTVKTIEVPEEDRMRFSISDDDATNLARMAVTIEQHYGRPMDIEWGKDGETGELFILQARPETVESRADQNVLERYQLNATGKVLVTGRSIGQRIGSGKVRIVPTIDDLNKVREGDVLVTDMTDPDWEPVMKRSAAIVTNRGGRTCHAAIIARELGVPAVVGCGDATTKLTDGADATVSCAEGDTGKVYDGLLDFEIKRHSLENMPELPFKVMMNVGSPERSFAFSRIPNAGVGLARLEFIINNTIGVHPKALLNYNEMTPELKRTIDQYSAGYADPVSFYVEKLTEGIASLGAAFAPKPVIVRLSDFKSNEYANMLGGEQFEPREENPMIGFRGTTRYISKSFRDCFELECQAVKKVREEMGLTNIWIMIPFVRTLEGARKVIDLLAENGLRRGEHDLKIIMMCEIPSNALLADQFLEYFDGFSIGSNDLTQLTLGLDRDSSLIAHLFDERDPAVKALLSRAIQACRKAGKYIGICGQGPSDHPDLARWLMDEGIESVSLNPDTVVETWLFLAGKEV
ncbi:MAG: phosphoenolpyruvate synthase [Pseudomonadota bacterium]|nr:phosphoenolpyruvate synthase [Pseudomonadota bacterium]